MAYMQNRRGRRLDTFESPALTGTNSLLCLGDSLMAGKLASGPNENYPVTVVGPALGATVVNDGRPGWASSDVALLSGALDVTLSTAGPIPASGAVTVTMLTAGSFRKSSSAAISWTGVATTDTGDTVPGVLQHVQNSGGATESWRFTRTTAGAPIATSQITFHCTEQDSRRDWALAVLVGTNNFLDGLNPYDVLRDLDLMVQYRTSAGSRFVIMTMPGSADSPVGAGNYDTYVDINNQMIRRFGDRVFDLRSHMIRYGLAEANVAATSNDLTDIGSDVVPRSIRYDNVHFTAPGYTGIGKCLARFIASRGIIVGTTPSVSTVPPDLGVTDVVARYYAQAQGTPADAQIGMILDDTFNLNLVYVTGTPTMRALGGKKYIDLAVGTNDGLDSSSWNNNLAAFTIAVTAYWSAAPAAESRIFGASGSRAYVSVRSDGTVSVWGGASPALISTAAPAAGQWHTIIGTFNGAFSALYVDGVQKVGTVGAATTNAGVAMARGGSNFGLRLTDVSVIGHAVTYREAMRIHAALRRSIPA